MKNHLTGIDFLRGLAALGIVGCHLSLANPTAGAKWLGMFTDLNVGVFAMLAGLFYAGSCAKFDSWSDYLKQRGSRLLVPYVLWSIFYVTIDIVFDTLAGKTLTFQPNSGRYWASVVFQGGGAAHLWFLIVLFYVQAIGFFPMKRMGASALSTSLCAVLGFGCITACSFLDGWFSNYPLRLTGFFLVGVTISRSLDVILKLPVFAVGGGVLLGFLLLTTGWKHGFIGTCVLSVPLVLFALAWNPQSEKLQRLGAWLGRTSFGVYLVHVCFAIALREVILRLGLPHNAAVFFVDQLAVWLLSILAVLSILHLAKRISILKYIFP